MKKFVKYFFKGLICMMLGLVVSCSDKEPEPELSVSTNEIDFKAEGGSESINVMSNVSWNISNIPSWVSVFPAQGKGEMSVNITADKNTSTEERKCNITVTTDKGSLSRQIRIEQEAAEPDPALSLSEYEINVEAEGKAKSIDINSNVPWIISDYPSWVSVSSTQGEKSTTISITIDKNTTTDSRNCTVSVKTTKGSLSREIRINQAGEEVILSTDLAVVSLAGEANSKQELCITSNTTWNLSGVPGWLNASAVSGNEKSTITLEAISANESATERTATLTITAGRKSVKVDVKQRGLLAPVTVIPKDIVALYYGISFELEATGNIYSFHCACIQESDVNRLTDKEIVRRVLQEDEMIYSDGYLLSRGIGNAGNGEAYYVCTVAFDQDEKQGELVKTRVEVPKYFDGDNDAWVSVNAIEYSSYYVWWQCTKQGYCHKYHVIMGGDLVEGDILGSLMAAFEINYYLKYNKKHWLAENLVLDIVTDYPNDHLFSTLHLGLSSNAPYSFAYAWGVFENGTLSSDVQGNAVEIVPSASSSTRSVKSERIDNRKASNFRSITLNEVRKIAAKKNK